MSRRRMAEVTVVVFLAFLLLFTSPANAAVIASDSFELYSLGSVIGQGASDSGWGSPYSGLASTNSATVPIRNVSTGVMLGYGQSLELGFSAVQSGTGTRANNNVVQRLFDSQTGTVYIGFAIETVGFDTSPSPGTTNLDFFQFYVNDESNDSGTNGSQANSLSIGIDYGAVSGATPVRFFARKGSGAVANNGVPHVNDTTYRLVFRLSKSGDNGGNYDEIALFIDQSAEGIADAARSGADATNLSAGTLTAISRMHVRIFGFDLADRVYLDNLRIATTYAEALPPLPASGDFDGDGDVDGADFVAWQTNYPKLSDATRAGGDADSDGDVDGVDFGVWQASFPLAPGPSTSPVPEPPSVWVMLSAAVAVWLGVRCPRQGKRDVQSNRCR